MAEGKAKLLAVKGVMDVEIQEHEIPHPKEDGLVIQILAAAICGSDKHICEIDIPHTPGVVGHEFVGRIVEMGERAAQTVHCYNGELKVGDRIVIYPHVSCQHCKTCMRFGNGISACENDYLYGGLLDRRPGGMNSDPSVWPYFKGGFGDYVYIFPNTFVWKVPEGMPSEIAVLMDPMAVAVKAVEHCMTSVGGMGEGVTTSSTCLVIGAGPIGIMAGMYLKAMGVRKLMISDFIEEKLQNAKRISGADVTLNMAGLSIEEQVKKVMEETDGEGADIVISCANAPAAAIGGLQMVRKLGYYVEVGCLGSFYGSRDMNINFHEIAFSRNVHITSVNAHSPATYDRAFKFLQQYDRYPFHELITHKFHDLSDFLPHIKKMTQPDYLKAVMIRNE